MATDLPPFGSHFVAREVHPPQRVPLDALPDGRCAAAAAMRHKLPRMMQSIGKRHVWFLPTATKDAECLAINDLWRAGIVRVAALRPKGARPDCPDAHAAWLA